MEGSDRADNGLAAPEADLWGIGAPTEHPYSARMFCTGKAGRGAVTRQAATDKRTTPVAMRAIGSSSSKHAGAVDRPAHASSRSSECGNADRHGVGVTEHALCGLAAVHTPTMSSASPPPGCGQRHQPPSDVCCAATHHREPALVRHWRDENPQMV